VRIFRLLSQINISVFLACYLDILVFNIVILLILLLKTLLLESDHEVYLLLIVLLDWKFSARQEDGVQFPIPTGAIPTGIIPTPIILTPLRHSLDGNVTLILTLTLIRQ